jgi:hypothetical protein
MIVIFVMNPRWIMFGLGLLYFVSGPVEWVIRAILRKPMPQATPINKAKKPEHKDVRLINTKNLP